MSGLPFLRLPQLIQSIVLGQVELVDLITLSFCSRKAKKIVKSMNVELDELSFQLEPFDFSVRVNKIFFIGYLMNPFCQLFLKGPGNREVLLLKTYAVPEEVTSLMIAHLLEAFRGKTIKMKTQTQNILNHLLWKHHKTIDNLCISEKRPKKMSVEEMKLIFEKLNITGVLKIFPAVVDGYEYSEGFQQDKVLINLAKWVQFSAILESRSSEIRLYEYPWPSDSVFRTFLKNWIAKKKTQNLKVFELDMVKTSSLNWGFLDIMFGIQHERLNRTTARVRRIDGKVAEVVTYAEYFKFQVIN